MSTNKKVLTNALTQFGGKIGTVIASFIVVKIISSFGKEFYGNYVTSYEFLAFFGILADAGLFAIAVRDISKLSDKTQEKAAFILGNILTMRLGLVFFATILAGIIAQFIPSYNEWIKMGIWITGISMFLTIIAGTLSAILQARMRIQYFSGSLVVGKVILAIAITLIAKNQLALESFMPIFFIFLWAGVFSNFVFVSLVYFFARREIPLKLKFDYHYWKTTFVESLPYGVALILQTLYLRADLVIISILLGSSAVGIYGVSARILESFLILGVFFGQAILPKMAQDEKNHKTANKTLSWGIEKCIIFAIPITWGIYLFAPQIIELLSSTEYLSTTDFIGSDKVLMVLIPTIIFAFLNQLFSFALVSKKKQKYLLYVNAVAFALNVLLNVIFLPTHGIVAAAFSTVLCEIIVLFGLGFVVLKYFHPKFNKINLLIIFGLNGFLFLLITQSPLKESLFLSIAISSTIYVGILGFFRKRFI